MNGLSSMGFLRRLPALGKLVITTLVIFTFINIWNDFYGIHGYLSSTKIKDHPVGYPHVYFPSRDRLCVNYGGVCVLPGSVLRLCSWYMPRGGLWRALRPAI